MDLLLGIGAVFILFSVGAYWYCREREKPPPPPQNTRSF